MFKHWFIGSRIWRACLSLAFVTCSGVANVSTPDRPTLPRPNEGLIYPREAFADGIPGSVVLDALVDARGRASQLRVLNEEPSDHGFAEQVLLQVRKLRFNRHDSEANRDSTVRVTWTVVFQPEHFDPFTRLYRGEQPPRIRNRISKHDSALKAFTEANPCIPPRLEFMEDWHAWSKPGLAEGTRWKGLIYPEEAFKAGIEGLAQVGFVVCADGSVSDLRILGERPEGHGFGMAAVKHIGVRRHIPGQIVEGVPGAILMQENIRFRMEDFDPVTRRHR